MKEINAETIRSLLQMTLKDRKTKNANYSLRSYARDLHIYPTELSLYLRGKRKISVKKAKQLMQRLSAAKYENFSPNQLTKMLLELPEEKELENQIYGEIASLNPEQLVGLKTYHFLALLELIPLAPIKKKISFEKVSNALNIEISHLKAIIERLKSLGLVVEQNSNFSKTRPLVSFLSDIPVKDAQALHHSFIHKAGTAMSDDVKERDISSCVFRFNSKKMDQVRQLIKEFRRSLMGTLENDSQSDSVYSLSINFFRLMSIPEDT